jgi:glycosyltransferase involved in cell wall biosynthesis
VGRSPAVTVVIPAYNRKALLRRALGSVLGQTYDDWEVVVADDGSTDGTPDLAGEFAAERVHFLRLPFRRGAAAARNAGVAASAGRILAFLDSDDEWQPEKLEKQMRAFETAAPDVGVVYTSTVRFFRGRTYDIPGASIRTREGNLFGPILRGLYIVPTPAAAVRRECLERVGGFDESLPALEEWDLWIRLAKVCRFAHVPEALTVSHYTLGSLSADRRLFLRAKRMIYRKHRRDFLKSPAALAALAVNMARLRAGLLVERIRGREADFEDGAE